MATRQVPAWIVRTQLVGKRSALKDSADGVAEGEANEDKGGEARGAHLKLRLCVRWDGGVLSAPAA